MRARYRSSAILIGLLLSSIVPGRADSPVDFNDAVRPLLSNACYRCHGPDDADRKAGLRLDTRDGAMADLGGYAALVPGDLEASALIRRVQSSDPDEVMPPPEAGIQLDATQMETLKRWVSEGAPYAKHWAYVPPQEPIPPKVTAPTGNAIDHFVRARLEKEGLANAPEAEKHHLARRVALDLTGLPPTAEEVALFSHSTDPDAYAHLVDGLLAKSAFGEHWARHWLDLARYADSAGYADDPERTIWAYRDYVIRSFNENKPFDVFTREQLAGDLLPNPSQDQLVATAFHRNTQTNNEGGTNDEEFRNVAVVDRVNTTFSVWMGTTMACAQCHTHKYDPISHEDYFRVFAIFNNSADADRRDESPTIGVETEAFRKAKDAKALELAAAEEAFYVGSPETHEAFATWQHELLAQSHDWHPLALASANEHAHVLTASPLTDEPVTALRLEISPNGENVVVNEIRLQNVGDKAAPPNGKFVRISLTGQNKILHLSEVEVFHRGTNVALQGNASQSSQYADADANRAIDGQTNGAYESQSVSHTGIDDMAPWWEVDLGNSISIERVVVWNRTDNGLASRLNGALVQVLDCDRQVVWSQTIDQAPESSLELPLDGTQSLLLRDASATFSQEQFDVSKAIDGDRSKKSGWAIAPQLEHKHAAVFQLAQPKAISQLQVTLEQHYPNHPLNDFQLFYTTAAQPIIEIAHTTRAILEKPASERSVEEERRLYDVFALDHPDLQENREHLAELRQELSNMQPPTTVPVMRDLSPENHRETHIQLRGNYLALGKRVVPGLPPELHPSKVASPDRLALADWLMDPDNPLTARVTANRYWEAIFGLGLVRTSEEFGSQGEPPSHPELLDWLARRLVSNGWDTKSLLKDIVMSSTYRQSSKVTPELIERDPENKLLARGPRFRLSAEMIRDQALAVSGLLSPKMYGPPVNPRQPDIGLNAAFGGKIDWKVSEGEDQYRRGLYTSWRRSNPYPSMATFDVPNREVCVVRRDRTNTPLQALVTLNDPVFMEAAQSLARVIVTPAASNEAPVDKAFQRVLMRSATAEERQALASLYQNTYETLSREPERALPLATDPLGPVPEGSDVVALASWAVVCNVILNLDETLLKL